MPVVKNLNNLTSEQLVKELRSRDVLIPLTSTSKKDVLINLYREHVLSRENLQNDGEYSGDDDNLMAGSTSLSSRISRKKQISKNLQTSLDDHCDISNLSDSELHAKLKQFNSHIGPVTNTTRIVYQKKLQSYMNKAAYSDNDDDDIEMEIDDNDAGNHDDDDDDDDDGGVVEGDDSDEDGGMEGGGEIIHPVKEPMITQRNVFTNWSKEEKFPTFKDLQEKHSSRRTTTTTTITTTKFGGGNNATKYDDDDDVIHAKNIENKSYSDAGNSSSSGVRFDYDYIRSTISPRPSLLSTYPTSFSHHYISKPLEYESTPLPPYSSPIISSAFNVPPRKRESNFDSENKYKVDRDSSRRKKVNQSGAGGWSCATILLVGLLLIGIVAFVVAFAYYFEMNPNLYLLV